MYKCPNCGGEIEFLPSDGVIKCQYCGSKFTVEDNLGKTRKNAEEQNMGEEGMIYTCSQCGASLYTEEDTGVTFCSFCGSQAFIKSRVNGKEDIEPDLIFPFKISKEKCIEIYKDKIKGAWFLPKGMKADKEIEKFRGIYMPCWIYSAKVDEKRNYKGTMTEHSKGYDIKKTYDINIDVKGEWDGFLFDATSSFPDTIMNEIGPFNIKMAEKYNDKYMAGFYADIGNVPSELYENQVKSSAAVDASSQMLRNSELAKYPGSGRTEASSGFKPEIRKVRKGYIPVWFLSNKNALTGRMSYAVVNGFNGKMHTDLPIDMKKYLILSLIIAAAAFIFFQFFTLKPEVLLVIAMILLGVMMSVTTKMISEAFIQEHGLDDAGLQYVKKDPLVEKVRNKEFQDTIKRKKPGSAWYGVLCFVLIPLLVSTLSTIYHAEVTGAGFIFGIILFIVGRCSFASKKETSYTSGAGMKRNLRLPFSITIRSLALPLIGIFIGVVVLFGAPASDLYYYLTVFLSCIILIIQVLIFVRKINALALRKPAQLGKRGGDEDAE